MVEKRLFFKIMAACSLIGIFIPVMPVVTHISVWRKYHNNEYHYCYYLPDWHHDYQNSSLGEGQRDQIIALAKMTKNPLVIVEAAADYDGPNSALALAAESYYNYQQEFKNSTHQHPTKIHKITSVLCSGLLPLCQKEGIATYNTECRHFNYASLAWQDTVEDVNRHMLEIALFKDLHPVLAEFYGSLDSHFQRITQTWSQQTINDILSDSALSPQEQQQRARQPYNALFVLGFDLLNAKTVLALLKGQDHKNIFICIGAAHVEKLENTMTLLGYTKVLKELDKSFLSPVDRVSNKMAINNVIDLKQAFMGTVFPCDPTILR